VATANASRHVIGTMLGVRIKKFLPTSADPRANEAQSPQTTLRPRLPFLHVPSLEAEARSLEAAVAPLNFNPEAEATGEKGAWFPQRALHPFWPCCGLRSADLDIGDDNGEEEDHLTALRPCEMVRARAPVPTLFIYVARLFLFVIWLANFFGEC
jgi:hypothetical protein